MSFKKSDSTHMKSLKTALGLLEPGDFVLTNSNTGFNKAISYGSQCPYGHAILYVGIVGNSHAFLEMPLQLHSPSAILENASCQSAMFVHCKKLKKSERAKIVNYALAYEKANKGSWKGAFDLLSALQGASSLVIGNTLGGLAGAASTTLEQGIRTLSEAPMTIVNEAFSMLDDYPALSCAGLVSWCHWKAGHLIDTRLFRAPHTASPRSLWDAAKGDTARFRCTTFTFK